jgi:hypothetical protein
LSALSGGKVGQSLAACGHEFKIDPVAANMPESSSMVTRAPLTAELCETPVGVTISEAWPLSDLDLGEFGAYRYDAGRATVWIRRPALEPDWEPEALTGPVLLHALAQRGVFVLHASAARPPGGPLIAFTAESGAGKSTLARMATEIGWQRVGDDLLPLAERDGQIVALPHLRQPKLADSQQYPSVAPRALVLSGLIHVGRGTKTRFERMSAREAADLCLVSTVATRVFASLSLAAHLAFTARLADAVAAGSLIAGRLTVADRPDDVAGAALEALEIVGRVAR